MYLWSHTHTIQLPTWFLFIFSYTHMLRHVHTRAFASRHEHIHINAHNACIHNPVLKKTLHTRTHTHTHWQSCHLIEVVSSGAEGDDLVGVPSLMGKHVGDGLAANVFTDTFHPTQSVDSDRGTRGMRQRGHPFPQDNFLFLFCRLRPLRCC